MTAKKDPVLTAIFECPKKCDEYLFKTYGLPQEPRTSKEVQQDCIRIRDQKTGRLVPVQLGDAGGSHTQQTDPLTSLRQEAGAVETAILSPAWVQYLGYFGVIAEDLHPKDQGAALKTLALAAAREKSALREQPPEVFHPMNAPLGTPAEFRERWFYGELEIRVSVSNRRNYSFEIWRLPPAELENLDAAGEPSGHWDGLKWTPGPEISGS